MILGVPLETHPGERRVAMAPTAVPALASAGIEVAVEAGAGAEAGFPDDAYRERGARVGSREDVFAADAVAAVRLAGAAPETSAQDLDRIREGLVLVGFADPLGSPEAIPEVARRGATLFAMELIPRITRAQPMDALSSQATVAGYRSVLLAATALPKMFPMLTTAAGTITPARVLVIGAGVAGLQAIATARRLGAVVEAYDIRPAVKEQIESLGARFVELPIEAEEAEQKGGYAREMDQEFYRRQRELLGETLTRTDAVITTALVPGAKAPVLVTADMVEGMAPGSVIVDLAAEQGGNCELSRPGETVVEHGVTIVGPANLPASAPYHASLMYSRNVSSFLTHLVKDGEVVVDLDDEITRETLVATGGHVVHARVRELLGESEPAEATPAEATPGGGA